MIACTNCVLLSKKRKTISGFSSLSTNSMSCSSGESNNWATNRGHKPKTGNDVFISTGDMEADCFVTARKMRGSALRMALPLRDFPYSGGL